MIDIVHLNKLSKFIKWNAVFKEAGLNANTMRSAMHHGRELRKEEVASILRVLRQNGIQISVSTQSNLFHQ